LDRWTERHLSTDTSRVLLGREDRICSGRHSAENISSCFDVDFRQEHSRDKAASYALVQREPTAMGFDNRASDR
jgi:hypothetical protein